MNGNVSRNHGVKSEGYKNIFDSCRAEAAGREGDPMKDKEIYRPTVRYDKVFGEYVNELFHVSTLDRNEIIRLALFTAPLGALFRSKVELYLNNGAAFPAPPWTPQMIHLWKGGMQDER